MRIFTYWTYSKNTGAIIEAKFRNGQVADRGWFVDDGHADYIGLSLAKADTLVKEWNRLGNKNGYFYYLDQPEAF
jgi:hypothetical protein